MAYQATRPLEAEEADRQIGEVETAILLLSEARQEVAKEMIEGTIGAEQTMIITILGGYLIRLTQKSL
jgi:hypothetical protein